MFLFSFDICSEWNRELDKAKGKNRKPRLRNAVYRMYSSKFIVDGLLCFGFIFIRYANICQL